MRPGGDSFKVVAAGDGPGEAGGGGRFSRSWGRLGWNRIELQALVTRGFCRRTLVLLHLGAPSGACRYGAGRTPGE